MANHPYRSKRRSKKRQHRESYRHYLRTPHWKNVRKLTLRMYRSCVLCGIRWGLEVHHRNYDRLYEEIISEDLIVLCGGCHNIYHNHSKPEELTPYAPKKKELTRLQDKLNTPTNRSINKNNHLNKPFNLSKMDEINSKLRKKKGL
ncbi:hypothetical protein LCGC14_0351710 [marine sediment metagenome]|uniref:HNH domain-containing protein n=1 Tax=marine sediment metagenome TaxID=412755 RepID=A0A0F9TTQ7_9ZZZZ